jgi:hypothetical protein
MKYFGFGANEFADNAMFLVAACARGVWARGLFDGYFG